MICKEVGLRDYHRLCSRHHSHSRCRSLGHHYQLGCRLLNLRGHSKWKRATNPAFWRERGREDVLGAFILVGQVYFVLAFYCGLLYNTHLSHLSQTTENNCNPRKFLSRCCCVVGNAAKWIITCLIIVVYMVVDCSFHGKIQRIIRWGEEKTVFEREGRHWVINCCLYTTSKILNCCLHAMLPVLYPSIARHYIMHTPFLLLQKYQY